MKALDYDTKTRSIPAAPWVDLHGISTNPGDPAGPVVDAWRNAGGTVERSVHPQNGQVNYRLLNVDRLEVAQIIVRDGRIHTVFRLEWMGSPTDPSGILALHRTLLAARGDDDGASHAFIYYSGVPGCRSIEHLLSLR